MPDPPSTITGPPDPSEPKSGGSVRVLRVGDRFAGHELLDVIARGGMGVVYRAREMRGGRIVALKTVLDVDDDDLLRFEFEARAASQLEHPGIVPVFHVGEIDGTPFFTMKYLTGGTLSDYAPRIRADPRRCAEVALGIAEAIHYAHERGILHRDLKPANVLMDGQTPRIVDFGLACALGDRQRQTRSGAMIGTPGYMAPEQASGQGRMATVLTDVYGLGAILYHLLTGQPPFAENTLLETLRMITSDDPADPRAIDPTIDRDLAAISLRALEKRPAARYPTAEGFAQDLRRWLEGLPVDARPRPRPVAWLRWVRRHPGRATVRVALCLLPPLLAIGAIVHLSALRSNHAQAVIRRDQILASNQFSARLAAGAVSWRLRELGEPLVAMARRPDLPELLATRDRAKLAAWLAARGLEMHQDLAEFERSPYEAWMLFHSAGDLLARWPEDGTPANAHDYVNARKPVGLHVSPVFRPVGVGEDRYGLSVTIGGPTRVHGWLVAEVGGGMLGLPAEHDNVRKIALVAQLRNRGGFRIIAHEAYVPGRAPVDADPAVFEAVEDTAGLTSYRDPVGGPYDGRWIAAIAAVRGAPFHVVIQERFDADDRAAAALRRGEDLWRLVGILAALGGFVIALVMWPRRPSTSGSRGPRRA